MSTFGDAKIKKPSLIYVGIDSWFSIHQRPQQLAKCLSEFFRVLYVDPACFTMLGYLRNHWRGDGSRIFRSRLQCIQQDLYLFRPTPTLPVPIHSHWANNLALRFLAYALDGVMKELEVEEPILILSWPLDLPLAGKLGETLLCYDCMDNYAAFKTHDSKRASFIATSEAELISRADLIFAASKPLQKRIRQHHPQTHLVGNGVSKWFLSYPNEQLDESLPPADWPKGNGPVIGYIGMIADWFDMDAIIQLAQRNPTWRIILIGPTTLDLQAYKTLSNLHFLGPKSHESLPYYASRFDVGLIPFLLTDLTVDVNPVKLYEYFALGLPVVASRLSELIEYNELLYLAENTEEFVSLVEKAVQERDTHSQNDGKALSRARGEVARHNTWEMRASSIKAAIDAYQHKCKNL